MLAAIILVPVIATIWMAAQKLAVPVAPAPVPLTLTGAGALLVDSRRRQILMRYRHHRRQPQPRGLSLRAERRAGQCRDHRRRPDHGLYAVHMADLIVGLGIAYINADAAFKVYKAAQKERDIAAPVP